MAGACEAGLGRASYAREAGAVEIGSACTENIALFQNAKAAKRRAPPLLFPFPFFPFSFSFFVFFFFPSTRLNFYFRKLGYLV